MKLRSALLLVVASTVCLLGTVFSPQDAAASVDAVTQWLATPPIVSNSNTGNVSGKFTVGVGNNRLLLVAVATEYTAGNPTITGVTYGGTPLTNIALATNNIGLNKIWVGYLVLGTGTTSSSAQIAVTNTGTAGLVATYVTAAVYNGVLQATPISGSGSASGSTATLTTTSFAVNGINGNNGLAVFISNFAGQALSSTGTATKVRDYAGVNMNIASGAEVIVTNAADNQTVTAAGAVSGVLAGIGLNPADRIATNTTCGDCHGNPPVDSTATRNAPPGQFPGSHDKHVGGNANQYSLLCTQCHYNNTTNAHSTGYKNITGSSVPGNAYKAAAGKKVPITNDASSFSYCTNVACHSNGRTSPRQYASSLVWGQTDTCLSCHGGRNSGTNAYATSTNGFNLSTTHGQHLGKYGYTLMNCNTCHGKTAASHTALVNYTGVAYHENGAKTVVFTNIAYGSYTSYKANKTCENVACHGGKTRGAWNENVSVNTTNTCVHCHGVAGTTTAVPNSGYNRRFFAPGWNKTGISTDATASSNDKRVGSHFKHLSSVYMKAIKCNECHRVPSNPFDVQHTDSPRYNSQTLTFAQASSATILIGVGSAANPSQLASFAGYTNGTAGKAVTCSSVYCHGNRLKNGPAGGTYTKPYWNYSAMINYTDPATACSRCHGNPPTSVSGSHLGKTPTTSCSGCHGSVVNPLGQIINKNLHIDGRVQGGGGHEWSFGGVRHRTGGTGSITATGVYPFTMCNGCHTTGTGGSYPPARGDATLVVCTTCHINSTNFQGGTPGCWDCHGSGAAAANAAPNGNAFPNISGSHSAHIALSYACADCHQGGGTLTAVHGNYSGKTAKVKANVVVKINTATAGPAATYSGSASMTCGTSVCHGQKSPQWGQAVPAQQCRRCHGSQSVSYANRSSAEVAPGTGNNDTSQTAGNTTARGGVHQEHLKANIVTPNKVSCNACHTVPSAVNHAKLDNRTTATVTFSGPAIAIGHGSASVTRVGGLITCNNTYCHTGTTNTGLAMAPVWNNSSYITGTGGAAALVLADCTRCHALPPPASGSHGGIAAVTTFPIGAGNCGSNCHNLNLTTGTTYATIFGDSTKHMNGIVEGGTCLGCHAVAAGTGAMKRAPVVGQFASQSHHIQKAGGVTNADCFVCHGEADSSGLTTASHGGSANPGAAVYLVIHQTGSRGTTYLAYTANSANAVEATRLSRNRTQMAKITTHCLSCHNAANVAYQPFAPGDTRTPIAYAWDGKSAGEKYIQTLTYAWGKFNFSGGTTPVGGTNAKSTVIKALSAHGNAANNDMSGPVQTDTAITDISGSVNVLCYDCHNSHGSAVAGITSQYSSSTGRNKGGLIKDITANTGGYKDEYRPAQHIASGPEHNTFNPGATLCFDCHSNRTAGTVLLAGYTSSHRAPWGYNSTFGASQPLNGYYDTPYFGNYTTPSAKRTAYKLGTANAKAKPMGGHYGVTSALTTTLTKQAFTTTVSAGINGLCTPCHDPHGVSTNAAYVATPANAVPLLKGTWVTSPYKEDKADIAVQRGGGSRYTGLTAGGAIPGYHIDQNTLVLQPNPTGSGGATTASAKSANRSQKFASFATSAATLQTTADTDFAGLCNQCHLKANLTNATAPSTTNWKTVPRIHQTVKGWAAATGTNTGNVIHAYTCSKCHAPHTSRLPRLMVTNCLDVNHFKQVATGGTISATPGTNVVGNLAKPVSSGGAGRFPAGGVEYTGAYNTSYNGGPWWFEQTAQGGGTAVYGSNCHNATNAGGTAYNPTNQRWNTKTPW